MEMLYIGIFIATISMVFYGVGDFLQGLGSKKINPITFLFWGQIVAIAFYFALFFIFKPHYIITSYILALAIVAGALIFVATLLFYKGLEIGKSSFMVPIANAAGALAAILGVVLLHEMLLSDQAFGVALTVIGILLMFDVINLKNLSIRKIEVEGFYAISTMALWGVFLLIIGFISKQMGPIMPGLIAYIISMLFTCAYVILRKKSVRLPKGTIRYVLPAWLFGSAGFALYTFATSFAYVSIVAPIALSSSAITVMLSIYVSKEKITQMRILGIAAVIVGIIMISI